MRRVLLSLSLVVSLAAQLFNLALGQPAPTLEIAPTEQTPRLRINYLIYPVDWEAKTIMIGARFQLPLGMGSRVPAVIVLHGTAGVRYTGVYYAAADVLAALAERLTDCR